MERSTIQKQAVLEYLKGVKTHPSAEIIFSAVRKKLPTISHGTIYRILNTLKQKGEIIEVAKEPARFDADTSPHAHFVCQDCGKIYDVFDKNISLINKKTKIGKVQNFQIYLYGQCRKCGN
ncbi:transcriptional repressor [Patescibacteria group bacterium]|nr:MAG: transcriptional repressor [Patescibacteria group bacterium]